MASAALCFGKFSAERRHRDKEERGKSVAVPDNASFFVLLLGYKEGGGEGGIGVKDFGSRLLPLFSSFIWSGRGAMRIPFFPFTRRRPFRRRRRRRRSPPPSSGPAAISA